MKEYWDSSALVAATLEPKVRARLDAAEALTRIHAFAEVFSTLTGSRLGFRVDAEDAARVIRELFEGIEIVELSSTEVLDALSGARSRGVRGGQVHDYLHAVAARKGNCEKLVTLNRADFEDLFDDLNIETP